MVQYLWLDPNRVSPSNGFVDRPPPLVPPSLPQECKTICTEIMLHVLEWSSCSPIPPSKVCKTICTQIMLLAYPLAYPHPPLKVCKTILTLRSCYMF